MVEEQWKFLRDVARLIDFIESRGHIATAGEMYRTRDQQLLYFRGFSLIDKFDHLECVPVTRRSKTMNSYHLKRLAIDLNIFIDGKLTYDPGVLKFIGDYWESLDPKNRWGGSWGWDAGHFERAV